MREPERERLSIILNELGVGLAGRGADLREVIRRANPALKEVDEVLRLLARQNDQLEQLAVDSDTIMAPLARERAHVASAIDNVEPGRRGHRRAARATSRPTSRSCRSSCASCARRWSGSARSRTR